LPRKQRGSSFGQSVSAVHGTHWLVVRSQAIWFVSPELGQSPLPEQPMHAPTSVWQIGTELLTAWHWSLFEQGAAHEWLPGQHTRASPASVVPVQSALVRHWAHRPSSQ
jgi:hypothetical protein